MHQFARSILFTTIVTTAPAAVAESGKCVIETAKNGTMVKVRGVVFPGGHDMFIRPEQCPENRVIVTYADDRSLKQIHHLHVQRDEAFRMFEQYLKEEQLSSPNEICRQCPKYEVNAELTGRLDIARSAGLKRNPKTGKVIRLEGYGHPLPFTRFRLVVTSVANVITKELLVDKKSALPEK